MMRAGGSYEDLEYLAIDKSMLYIKHHFEDYEDGWVWVTIKSVINRSEFRF